MLSSYIYVNWKMQEYNFALIIAVLAKNHISFQRRCMGYCPQTYVVIEFQEIITRLYVSNRFNTIMAVHGN